MKVEGGLSDPRVVLMLLGNMGRTNGPPLDARSAPAPSPAPALGSPTRSPSRTARVVPLDVALPPLPTSGAAGPSPGAPRGERSPSGGADCEPAPEQAGVALPAHSPGQGGLPEAARAGNAAAGSGGAPDSGAAMGAAGDCPPVPTAASPTAAAAAPWLPAGPPSGGATPGPADAPPPRADGTPSGSRGPTRGGSAGGVVTDGADSGPAAAVTGKAPSDVPRPRRRFVWLGALCAGFPLRLRCDCLSSLTRGPHRAARSSTLSTASASFDNPQALPSTPRPSDAAPQAAGTAPSSPLAAAGAGSGDRAGVGGRRPGAAAVPASGVGAGDGTDTSRWGLVARSLLAALELGRGDLAKLHRLFLDDMGATTAVPPSALTATVAPGVATVTLRAVILLTGCPTSPFLEFLLAQLVVSAGLGSDVEPACLNRAAAVKAGGCQAAGGGKGVGRADGAAVVAIVFRGMHV